MAALISLKPKILDYKYLLLAIGITLVFNGYVTTGLVFFAPVLLISFGLQSWAFLCKADRFGDLSYGIYLWAWPVQESVVYIIGKDTNMLLQLAITLCITRLLALGSWHLIELPALGYKPAKQ